MVSIIVPVYKSELTLRRCVESILAQDYADFEILLIVDGPPDGSGILAEELAGEDARVIVINQSNQGVSKARNTGIAAARGEYIRFLDSDDYMPEHALAPMVKAMEEDGSDMVITGFDHLYFGQTIVKMPHKQGCITVSDAKEDVRRLYSDNFLNMPWNKLYKKELIEEGFPTDRNLGEDLIFNQNYMKRAKKISILQHSVCAYIQDDRGTTLSTKKRDDKIDTALALYKESRGFFDALYRMEPEDYVFLDTKVITTFLDDLELMGFDRETGATRKKESIATYQQAARDFCREYKVQRIDLQLLDYKIIYFFWMRGMKNMTLLMIELRALVVKLVRALKKIGNKK